MIYNEIKTLKAKDENSGGTITKGRKYVVLDSKENRFLVKNDKGSLEWVHEDTFVSSNKIQILAPMQNVVYVGPAKNGLTQGTPYSFFKENSDSYYIFNDSYEFKWYKTNLFKLENEFRPEHIEEFNKLIEKEKNIESSLKKAKSSKLKLKSEPKIFKYNIVLFIAAFIIINPINHISNKDLLISAIMAIIIIAKNIEMFHKLFYVRKYNSEVEQKNNESIENAYLLSLLTPEILTKLTAIENRISDLSEEVIIGRTFMNSMTGYILSWIKLSENNNSIPESTSKLILDYIDSCNRYIDEQYLTINIDKFTVSKTLEKMANSEIQKQTNLMNTAREDLKLINKLP